MAGPAGPLLQEKTLFPDSRNRPFHQNPVDGHLSVLQPRADIIIRHIRPDPETARRTQSPHPWPCRLGAGGCPHCRNIDPLRNARHRQARGPRRYRQGRHADHRQIRPDLRGQRRQTRIQQQLQHIHVLITLAERPLQRRIHPHPSSSSARTTTSYWTKLPAAFSSNSPPNPMSSV